MIEHSPARDTQCQASFAPGELPRRLNIEMLLDSEVRIQKNGPQQPAEVIFKNKWRKKVIRQLKNNFSSQEVLYRVPNSRIVGDSFEVFYFFFIWTNAT